MRGTVGALLAILGAMALCLVVMPECQLEDSTMCYWNATTSGNGQGMSYIALTEDITIQFTNS